MDISSSKALLLWVLKGDIKDSILYFVYPLISIPPLQPPPAQHTQEVHSEYFQGLFPSFQCSFGQYIYTLFSHETLSPWLLSPDAEDSAPWSGLVTLLRFRSHVLMALISLIPQLGTQVIVKNKEICSRCGHVGRRDQHRNLMTSQIHPGVLVCGSGLSRGQSYGAWPITALALSRLQSLLKVT